MVKITVYDTETTSNDPENDRIIEFACMMIDENGTELFRFTKLVNPKMKIAPKATALHGYSAADVIDCPTIDTLLPAISRIIEKSDYICGHNIAGFDNIILENEYKRCGLIMPALPEVIDTMQWRGVTPDGKAPRLEELAWAMGVDYDKSEAHKAMYDVNVSAQCVLKGLPLRGKLLGIT